MFTGIVEAVGAIASLHKQGADCRIRIHTDTLGLASCQIGDSIAVNGVCLTATQLSDNHFWADASQETLQRTTLGQLSCGDAVNLERAVQPTTRLGGHLVSGHVDGTAQVIQVEAVGVSKRYHMQTPQPLMPYIAEKGSITVDGVSLTINQVQDCIFTVNIVPHTLQHTIFTHYRPQSLVNIEVDVIARYVARLMQFQTDAPRQNATIDEHFLSQNGFL